MKALEVTKVMNELEQTGKAVSSMADIKVNDPVAFKPGTPSFDNGPEGGSKGNPAMGLGNGNYGIVVALHPESNTVDVKWGKATKINIPIEDLLKNPVGTSYQA